MLQGECQDEPETDYNGDESSDLDMNLFQPDVENICNDKNNNNVTRQK